MLRRLRERHLLKQVFTAEVETFDARIRETVTALPKTEKDQVRTEIEQKVAEFLAHELGVEVDPDFVIVHAYDIKSARETSSNDEEDVLVHLSPTPRAFIDVSNLFKSINAAYTDKCVEVYAPITWRERDKKEESRGAIAPVPRISTKSGPFHPGSGLSPSLDQLGAIEREASFL